jgi:hypothetical protein
MSLDIKQVEAILEKAKQDHIARTPYYTNEEPLVIENHSAPAVSDFFKNYGRGHINQDILKQSISYASTMKTLV